MAINIETLTWSAWEKMLNLKRGIHIILFPQGSGIFLEEEYWEIVRAKGGDNLKETIFQTQQGSCHDDCDSMHKTCSCSSQTESQKGGLKVGAKSYHLAEELGKEKPIFPY